MALEKGSFGNRTYTAVWEKKKYTIIYNKDYYGNNSKNITKKVYTIDDAFKTIPYVSVIQHQKPDHTVTAWITESFKNTLWHYKYAPVEFTNVTKICMVLQLMEVNDMSEVVLDVYPDIGPALGIAES